MKTRDLFLALTLTLAAAVLPAASLTFDPPANLTTPPADATRTDSGLVSQQLSAGKGVTHPAETDVVQVQYVVWTPEGKKIDGVLEPKMAVIPVSSMMPGWREGVAQMVAGEQRRFWIPEALAKMGKSQPSGGLVIDTALLGIIHMPPTPEVATVPADAERSKSGLAWKVVKPGDGTTHPNKKSIVVVNYTGWTSDGKMFDSSLLRGTPAEFPLKGIIEGWVEGLPMMTVGEERIFWIPAKLAYQAFPDKPQGTLVFDVQLLGVR